MIVPISKTLKLFVRHLYNGPTINKITNIFEKGIPFSTAKVADSDESQAIQRFFPPQQEQVQSPSKVENRAFQFAIPKESISCDKTEREEIARFFGIQQSNVSEKTGEALKDEIIANMLSNIVNEEKSSPKEMADIAKFFGKKKTKQQEESKTKAAFPNQFKLVFNTNQEVDQEELQVVRQFFSEKVVEKKQSSKVTNLSKTAIKNQQRTVSSAREADIALFNKWFGKNITTKSNSCSCR